MNPSVEIIKIMCTCGNELGQKQYELTAKNDFKNFSRQYNLSNSETTDDILFKEFDPNMKLCCQLACRYPPTACLCVNQANDSRRMYPTALEGPVTIVKMLEWYE